MIKVEEGIYIGCDADVDEFYGDHQGFCLHMAKEPYHRKAVGYTGRGAPKDHPEYLIAERDTFNAYNLVDSPKPEFIPHEIFAHACETIAEMREKGVPVLINCNQGKSRSVAVYLYYRCKTTGCHLTDAIDYLEDELEYDFELGDGVAGALVDWLA